MIHESSCSACFNIMEAIDTNLLENHFGSGSEKLLTERVKVPRLKVNFGRK